MVTFAAALTRLVAATETCPAVPAAVAAALTASTLAAVHSTVPVTVTAVGLLLACRVPVQLVAAVA